MKSTALSVDFCKCKFIVLSEVKGYKGFKYNQGGKEGDEKVSGFSYWNVVHNINIGIFANCICW